MSEWWRLFIDLGVCLVPETSLWSERWCYMVYGGVLGMSDSVGSRRRILYVSVVVEVVLRIHWWSESKW